MDVRLVVSTQCGIAACLMRFYFSNQEIFIWNVNACEFCCREIQHRRLTWRAQYSRVLTSNRKFVDGRLSFSISSSNGSWCTNTDHIWHEYQCYMVAHDLVLEPSHVLDSFGFSSISIGWQSFTSVSRSLRFHFVDSRQQLNTCTFTFSHLFSQCLCRNL